MADINTRFGALTKAGAGGVAVTGTSISSGDASGHWQISGGFISPSATGDTADLNAGPYSLTLDNAETVDIVIDADAYDVRLQAEWDTVTGYSVATLGGSTIYVRPNVSLTSGAVGTNATFLYRQDYSSNGGLVIEGRDYSSEAVAPEFDKWIMRGTRNVTLRGTKTTKVAEVKVQLTAESANPLYDITIDNNYISGDNTGDPNDATWSTSTNYPNNNINMIQTQGSAVDSVGNLTITNNLVEWGATLISVKVDRTAGDTSTITGNRLRYFYDDGVKVSHAGNKDCPTIIADNVASECVGLETDSAAPHPDGYQLVAVQTATADMTCTVERNIYFPGNARGATACQGHIANGFDNGTTDSEKYFTGTWIGNLLVTDSTVGMIIGNGKNIVALNNTVVSYGAGNSGGEGTPVFFIAHETNNKQSTAGTHTVERNIVDQYVIGGTYTEADNIELGKGGATTAYSTVFDGPSFDPDTRAEALTWFSRKASGPADLSGQYDAGAVGSGAVDFPTTSPGSDGLTVPPTLETIESTFDIPDQDAEGWSILPTANDSRLLYFDPVGGDDGTAVIYTPGHASIGSDIHDPVGPIAAYSTLEAAYADTRSDKPDWILVKRGTTYERDNVALVTIKLKGGRSATEYGGITTYGDSADPAPIIETKRNGAFQTENDARFCACIGIDWYAHWRDPDNVNFAGFGSVAGNHGFLCYKNSANDLASHLLVEGCKFRFFDGNSASSDTTETYLENVIIRRNVLAKNYAEDAHAQGFFSDRANLLVEQNVLYHNGWLTQQVTPGGVTKTSGQATQFNHGMYISGTKNSIIRNNVIADSSLMGIKLTSNPAVTNSVIARDIFVVNNLIIGGEIGVSAGGNNDFGDGYRFDNMNIIDNVLINIGESRPTNRDLAWGFEITDWEEGVIRGNVVAHFGEAEGADTIDNTYGLEFLNYTGAVDITSNKFYDLNGESYRAAVYINSTTNTNNITFSSNDVQMQADYKCVRLPDIGATVANNRYDSTATLPFTANGVAVDFDDWVIDVSSTGEQFTEVAYFDPDRDLASYMTSLGETGTKAEYYTQIQALDRFNWNEDLLAPAVNEYIREGFSENSPALPLPPGQRLARSVAYDRITHFVKPLDVESVFGFAPGEYVNTVTTNLGALDVKYWKSVTDGTFTDGVDGAVVGTTYLQGQALQWKLVT